jgi:hypothetical protein
LCWVRSDDHSGLQIEYSVIDLQPFIGADYSFDHPSRVPEETVLSFQQSERNYPILVDKG